MTSCFQYYKVKITTILIFLLSAYPVFGNAFYDSLPDIKLEEIIIIDNYTVEVGIGSDNHSVSCNIFDAVNSIPNFRSDINQDTVFVNNQKIYYFREGLYTWDRKGKHRVRLTTNYIRKFGNIQIHIPNREPKTPPEIKQRIEPIPPPAKNLLENTVPARKPAPKKLKKKTTRGGIIKGFRLAQFGMDKKQLAKAIQVDFDLAESEIEIQVDPKSGQHILSVASEVLDPDNGIALINYYLSSQDQTLNRVEVIWGHPDHSTVEPLTLIKSAKKFKNLFSQFRYLTTPDKKALKNKKAYIFYGIDSGGNGINMQWDNPHEKDIQPKSKQKRMLALSYFQSTE